MAKLLVFLLLIAIAVAVFSALAEEEQIQQKLEEKHLRLPRDTCDLSAVEAGDAACTAHCTVKGFDGGWCEQGDCHCRS
ncbi:U-Asilidin(12)-Dg3b-like isoform X1 [Cotesia typhae]|uniref:U-Asilidin(12)-Dg3b-like isoform X1 n=1 Tax=Cotesia typhae TaxID=2053667 RepID=UPI003D6872BA